MISIKNSNLIFIFFSLVIAFFGLLKSLIFAKYLPLESLGMLALFQSAMALFGTFHFGILSGGYRLSSFYSEDRFKQLNGNVYILLFALCIFLGIVVFFLGINGVFGEKDVLIYSSFVAGFISLFSNWTMNVSIARGNLNFVNVAQLFGAISSLVAVMFIFDFGVRAAYVSVFIQPLVIALFLAKFVDYTLPNYFRYDKDVVLEIFRSGLFPFLAGLFFISYQQLERILIGYALDVEELGKLTVFYLVYTVWSIVPDSLNKILYPKITLLMESKSYLQSKVILIKHLFFIIVYCVMCSVLLIIMLPPLIDMLLPQHREFVKFVHAGLVVYIVKSLCETPSIYLLALAKNKQILFADCFCFFAYVICFAISSLFFSLTIDSFIILASLYFVLKFTVLLYQAVSVHFTWYSAARQ